MSERVSRRCPIDEHNCRLSKCLRNERSPECDQWVYKLATFIRVSWLGMDLVEASGKVRREMNKINEELIGGAIRKLGVDDELFRQRLQDELDRRADESS